MFPNKKRKTPIGGPLCGLGDGMVWCIVVVGRPAA